jgi:hypothetical protein
MAYPLVALSPSPDLFICAKDLFVGAKQAGAEPFPAALNCAVVGGDGHAAEHPELVVAIVHAASSDWAARVICAALEDTPRRNAGRSRSLAPPSLITMLLVSTYDLIRRCFRLHRKRLLFRRCAGLSCE